VQPGFIELRAADAAALGVSEGDGVEVGDQLARLEVRINDTMAAGCAGFSSGHSGCGNLQALAGVSLRRAQDWRRRAPQLIGSDAGSGGAHD
jgi:hypothetical protein